MSGTGGAEVLAGGPSDPAAGPAGSDPWPGRPAWVVPALAAVLGILVGAVGASAAGRAGTGAGASGASQSSGPTSSAASLGVVVPEVVDAQTLPGSAMEVVAEAVPGASTPGPLRYDYSLVGAAWLAPDGTVRTGPPGCTRTAGEVQYLQVAVVHARAVAGGPNADRVVWFRCAAAPTPAGS